MGTWDRWAYHIQGLKRISQLRGGWHQLNSDLHLFACWFDVIGSVVKDSLPQLSEDFSSPGSPPAYRASQSSFVHALLENLTGRTAHAGELVLALDRVAAISDFVNAHCHQPEFWKQENDLTSLTMLGPATHILLSMPRFDTSDTNCFEFVHEMTRLTLLILLAGLKREYELVAAEMELLQCKLCHLLQGKTIDQCSFLLPELQIWALVTAALLQTPGPERNLYFKELSRRMTARNLPDGASVIEIARNIIWIEALAKPCIIDTLISEIDMAHSTST